MSEKGRSFWGFGRKKAAPPAEPVPPTEDAAKDDGVSVQTATPTAAEDGPTQSSGGWFAKLKQGLSRSSNSLGDSVSGLFTKSKLDANSIQDLEDILIQADLGLDTAMAITDRLSEGRFKRGIEGEELQEVLAEEVERVLGPLAVPLSVAGPSPFVILVVGVNGTGKTTTI
ncbi:MAG: signal recognition particle receptor subunit alpha, partial [Pseudomonadota bacterium]